MNNFKAICVALWVFILFQTSISWADPIIIDNNLDKRNISQYMEYASLTDQDATVEDITNASVVWEKIQTGNFAVHDKAHQHWLRFTIDNIDNREIIWFLELDSPFINRVNLYSQDDTGKYQSKTAGFLIPFYTREVKDRNIIFKISQSPGKQTLYLRIEDEEPLNCHMTLMSATGYNNKLKKELPFFWLFYGLMIAMVFYNLFIYISVREGAHLYYVLFISAATVFCFANNGFASQYLWPGNVYMATNSILVLWSLLPGLAWLYITVHDDTKNKSPLTHKIGSSFIVVPSFVSALLSFYITKLGMSDVNFFVIFVLFLSILSLIAVIIALTYLPYSAFILKSRESHIILAAFLCLLISIPISLMGQRGILPTHFLVRHAYQFGFAMMTLLLSFGLADKINLMKIELMKRLNAQTELRQSKRDLRNAEEKYRNIFEDSLEGIFQTTKEKQPGNDGLFISANPAMIKILGYDSYEELNKTIESIPGQCFADSNDGITFLKTIAEQGQVIGFEAQLLRKKGSKFWGSISAREVVDETNNNHYYEGTLVDISDRKQREEAEKKHQTAEAANRMKSEFLASMSHEIRTPMNAIIGLTDLALATDLTPKQQDYLQKIDISARSLLGIINDILDFSKIEAGKLNLETVDFNLNQVMDNVTSLFSLKVAEKNIELTSIVEDDVPCALKGDPLRLGQILTNLVSNAVKFTDQGGISIYVGLEKKDDPRVHLKFIVKDTGIGITKEQASNIFSSYTQAETSTTRRFGGTGLGLTICKLLVELMNGKIWVESEPGKGTTFIFIAEFDYLSKDRESALEATQTTCKESNAGTKQNILESLKGKQILLVEDNNINRQVAEEILNQAGLIVITAENGQEAVDATTSHGFDAILMDIEMPVMDGYEATRIIRNTLYLNNLPIIAMTAHAMQGYREKCLKAGMNDYITKPIDTLKLLQTLCAHIHPNKEMETGIMMHSNETPSSQNDLPENPPGIDLTGALGRMEGDKKLFRKIVTMFIEDYGNASLELKELVDKGDMAVAKRLMHSVKGAASNLGAEELCAAAEKMEITIEQGDLDNYENLISDFQSKLLQAIDSIERIKTKFAEI